jgi:hypothetical protein
VTEPKLIGLKEHPRAAPAIRRAKTWGALAGFLAAGAGGLLHGTPLFDAGLRALGGGILAYMLVWMAATAIWRQILHAEARHLVLEARARAEQR